MTVDDTYGTELFILSQSHIKIGTIDVVWGSGVLQAQDLTDLEEDDKLLSFFNSDEIQNVIMLWITSKTPLDDITLRKTIIHVIDKKAFNDKELGAVQHVLLTMSFQLIHHIVMLT